jgi:hypothetical protein
LPHLRIHETRNKLTRQWFDPTPESRAAWAEWLADRPEAVRLVAERFEPWALYWLKLSNKWVSVRSFEVQEDGSVTMTVNISAEFNTGAFERSVFGIKPEDLESRDA